MIFISVRPKLCYSILVVLKTIFLGNVLSSVRQCNTISWERYYDPKKNTIIIISLIQAIIHILQNESIQGAFYIEKVVITRKLYSGLHVAHCYNHKYDFIITHMYNHIQTMKYDHYDYYDQDVSIYIYILYFTHWRFLLE